MPSECPIKQSDTPRLSHNKVNQCDSAAPPPSVPSHYTAKQSSLEQHRRNLCHPSVPSSRVRLRSITAVCADQPNESWPLSNRQVHKTLNSDLATCCGLSQHVLTCRDNLATGWCLLQHVVTCRSDLATCCGLSQHVLTCGDKLATGWCLLQHVVTCRN